MADGAINPARKPATFGQPWSPRVGHITRGRDECHAPIIEPHGVVNTGDTGSILAAANDVRV